jgi:uncharacterized protein (DUF1501 family)
MDSTRREVLRLGLGSSTLLATGTTVPRFLARSAAALADTPAASMKGHILVVLQLDGGNDGLNTVIPYRDDAYRRARPRLQVLANEVKTIDDHVAFHPSLTDFARLLENQRLAIVQEVGYPNPNRSHFESMTIWQTARLVPDAATPGWLARALDHHAASGGDAPGLHVHDRFPLPRALAGGSQVLPSIERLDQFRRRIGAPDGAVAARQRESLDRLSRQQTGPPGSLLQFVERSTLITYASSARLEVLRDEASTSTSAKYPTYYALAGRLRLIAQLIKADLTTTLYYTHLDGFDTHADQSRHHANLLGELGASVRAFLDDLDQAGAADRVLVLVFSEFGRRLAENASGGTDHGTAAPVFLLGKAVHPGLHGPYPDLEHLDDDGDPRFAIDFRRVYATLLDQWLSVPSAAALGGVFEPLPLLRA